MCSPRPNLAHSERKKGPAAHRLGTPACPQDLVTTPMESIEKVDHCGWPLKKPAPMTPIVVGLTGLATGPSHRLPSTYKVYCPPMYDSLSQWPVESCRTRARC